MKQEETKKKGIIIAGISAIVLIAVLGISFAFWNYSRTTDNQILVAGDIFMKYTETNQLVIKNALPSKEPGENDYFEFKITGKNTYNKPIWYEIVLNHGVENPEGRTERLLDKFLKFRLVEIKGEEEQTVVDNASYEDITSKKIWINTIPAGTKDNIEITYKLYMWISFDTRIGNTGANDYDMETWNNQVYASVRVSVNGDFEEKELEKGIQYGTGTNVVKDTIGKDGGVSAVTNDGNITNTLDENIREYRYVDDTPDNYIYLKNNTENNELWRIVGVFKENDSSAEYIKVVKNEVLQSEILPSNYTINGNNYKIKVGEDVHPNSVYWNYLKGNDEDTNDWTTAGLQYYLNTEEDQTKSNKGYLSYLSETTKNMIHETTYYLGNVNSGWFADNYPNISNDLYQEERNCGNRENCTWKGQIGLLYPTDILYAGKDSDYYMTEGWLVDSIIDKDDLHNYWLLSPEYDEDIKNMVCNFLAHDPTFDAYYINQVDERYISGMGTYVWYFSVLPTFYLKSEVEIVSGNGTIDNPYQVSLPN